MNIVPFGKYKGQPVEVMQQDQQYIDWLTNQDWFRNRYPTINQVIINNFQEPSETPEHNKLQAKFTDSVFLDKFEKYISDFTDSSENATNFMIERKYGINFENSYDVQFIASYEYNYFCERHNKKFEGKASKEFGIEIKPCLGDDYPAIKRQILNIKYSGIPIKILLYDNFTAIGATLEQIKIMLRPIHVV
jgi:hypothetical protein